MGIQKSNLHKITALTLLSLFLVLGISAQCKKYKKKRKKHRTTQSIKSDASFSEVSNNRVRDSIYKKLGYITENECERPPSFIKGDKAYEKLMADSLRVPKTILEGEDENARIYIQCILETDGTISQTKIINKIPKNASKECEEEAIRFAKSTSKMWGTCGGANGRTYKCIFTLGIEFKATNRIK